ncbi:hypothetical protein P0D73_45915 [Paraburkholderia sp. RL18-101-BIB-B]|uniref:hypothetical protein n=1 Tax=unclassified Paraburkholderia TaxID=2615204 RepID=UPI0038BA63F7
MQGNELVIFGPDHANHDVKNDGPAAFIEGKNPFAPAKMYRAERNRRDDDERPPTIQCCDRTAQQHERQEQVPHNVREDACRRNGEREDEHVKQEQGEEDRHIDDIRPCAQVDQPISDFLHSPFPR